jgi:hypothetical protein
MLIMIFFSVSFAYTTPIYTVEANNLYDAGYQIGKLASKQFHQWFNESEFQKTYNFVKTTKLGQEAFSNFRSDNSKAFPELLEEMKGMAVGSGVSLEKIWISNLIPELESLQPKNNNRKTDHCTDLFSHDYDGQALHGHNEDWSEAVKPLWYLVHLKPLRGANFTECSGMAYPGTILGYAVTWSKYMYTTQNSLFPQTTLSHGLSCTFVQRRATCGIGNSPTKTLHQAVERLNTSGWAASASINLVSLVDSSMANVEAYENDFSVYNVKKNYSHENMFKHLISGEDAEKNDKSTEERQKRIWSLQIPKSAKEIARILGDTYQPTGYPIYRSITLATFILTGTNMLHVWVDANPSKIEPTFNISLRAITQ